ncbi:MAG: hypothetical protein PGN34_15445 [Methylobacterium frigidaeris]
MRDSDPTDEQDGCAGGPKWRSRRNRWLIVPGALYAVNETSFLKNTRRETILPFPNIRGEDASSMG